MTARLIRYLPLLCVSTMLSSAAVTLIGSGELGSLRGVFTLLALLLVALVWMHELGAFTGRWGSKRWANSVRQKSSPLAPPRSTRGNLAQHWWVDLKHRQSTRARSHARR